MKVVIQRVDSSSVKVNMDEISSIDNGLLILWGVEVGDTIEMDEAIVEIATDKVDSEVPSEVEGTLVEILFNQDDVVEVSCSVLCRLTGAPPMP